MSMPPIDSPVSSFEVRCRVGQFVMDSDDPDRAPDLIAVGGAVTIEPDLRRPIRVTGPDGPRVVGVDALEFTIDTATGKLVHPDGQPGVELIDPTDEHLDPQGWTYTANVRPEKGRPWSVTFGAPADGNVVDLGGIVSVAPSPGVTENYLQQTVTARDAAESFAVRAETAATEAEDWAPSFDWDGTSLVIDGETGPDLEGPAGPPVEGVGDVPGLQDALNRVTIGTGWRDIRPLADGLNDPEVTIGRSDINRIGPWVTLRGWTRTTDDLLSVILYEQTDVPGFKMDGNYDLPAGTAGNGTSTAGTLSSAVAMRLKPGPGATGKTMYFHVTWLTVDPWPVTLPGTPR